jgi:hypothetical protein
MSDEAALPLTLTDNESEIKKLKYRFSLIDDFMASL